jgi:hypothetical protein
MTSWSIYLLVAPVMINAELAIGQVDNADSNELIARINYSELRKPKSLKIIFVVLDLRNSE